jgi:cellulose synthase/poly-beta-1,6-N-acetylglucosamine synthase-like glycosyltransferase
LFALACLSGFVLFPSTTLVLGIVALLLQVVLAGLQSWVSQKCLEASADCPSSAASGSATPFVSVLVPASAEPAELVTRTLRAAAKLDWPAYEVLVIDNNTPSEEQWQPVERLCRELGDKVRFFHVENLRGAKAGALNFALDRIDPRAQYILVVDADYCLTPDAIRAAVAAAVRGAGAHLVQFPQHYRNVSPDNEGMAWELEVFFSVYQRAAASLSCAACTGTLSFVRVSALRAVGGFDGSVITEDADLGLRLLLKGFSTRYVHRVIGSGILPLDTISLKKQRWRWAFGNLQVITKCFRWLVGSAELDFRQKLCSLALLTAWLNPLALPLVLLLMAALVSSVNGHLSNFQDLTVSIAGATCAVYALGSACAYRPMLREGCPPATLASAWLMHAGLAFTGALVPVHALAVTLAPPAFQRTNKSPAHSNGGRAGVVPEVALGIALLWAAVALLMEGLILGSLGALGSAAAAFSIINVHVHAARTRRHTA